MTISVYNQRTGERLTFDDPTGLVLHLWHRLKTTSHWLLQYDDVEIRTPDGWTHTYRGDYVLLHALAGVPIPGIPDQPTVSIAPAVAGRQQP